MELLSCQKNINGIINLFVNKVITPRAENPIRMNGKMAESKTEQNASAASTMAAGGVIGATTIIITYNESPTCSFTSIPHHTRTDNTSRGAWHPEYMVSWQTYTEMTRDARQVLDANGYPHNKWRDIDCSESMYR